MSENARKDRLLREALGDERAPMPSAEVTPRIAYVGLVLLVVAAVSGGVRIDSGMRAAQARTQAAATYPAPAVDAAEGNVADLTH